MKKYDVFISYRRDGGDSFAQSVYDRLINRGYRVFFDLESLRSGTFNTQIYEKIDQCKDVLVILPPRGLDRCDSEDDWVRQEIAYGIKQNKNIIPIMMNGFEWPDNLPEDISILKLYEGISDNKSYFDAVLDKICFQMESKPYNKIKKRLILGLIALILVLIIGVLFYITSDIKTADPMENSSAEESYIVEAETIDEYINYLKKHGGEVVFYEFGDFDNDNHTEMFAIVGEHITSDIESQYVGELWFINKKSAIKIKDHEIYWDDTQTMLFDNTEILILSKYLTTGTITYVWGVRDGAPYELPFSGKIDGLKRGTKNEFEGTGSEYDFTSEDSWENGSLETSYYGHTYKTYYFYFDGQNFREYGGATITLDDFKLFKNADKCINKITKNGEIISSILYRSNDTITVNLQLVETNPEDSRLKNITYSNVTYRVNGPNLENPVYDSGNYNSCLVSSIAVFPSDEELDFQNHYINPQ